jgi:hypothetical protein
MLATLLFRLPAQSVEPLRGHLLMGGADPQGNRIGVNSRWLEWNGKPWLPVMGEFHYSRCPAERWEDELRKIRAGGVTLLATYVFWIHHEETEGVFDWSGQRDLRRFLELCRRIGLQVGLRIGPFCHGECRNGGVPDWMYGQPFEIRSNDPRYLAIADRFYRQIFAQVRGLFFQEGGPIVAVQVENEYLSTGAPWETTHFPDTEWQTAGAGGEDHMGLLQDLAKQAGFDPALWLCTGWGLTRFPADRFLPMFGAYAYYGWQDDPENHEKSGGFVYRDMWTQAHQPPKAYDPLRAPYACCEIGGGMQVFYRHRPIVPPESVEAMNNVILANGSNLMGTYVYHGGVNPDGVGGLPFNEHRVPRKSYDFQAPLGEFGQRRESYDRLRRLYLFLQHAGERLATAAPLLPEDQPLVQPADLRSLRAAVRADGEGRGFLFLCNFQDHAEMTAKPDARAVLRTPQGEDRVFPAVGRLDLAPGSSLILPLDLDLCGVRLKQAGTQFLAIHREPGQPDRFFFFVPSGMDTPHYRFDGGVGIPNAGPGVECRDLAGDRLVIVPADKPSLFDVRADDGVRRIHTLPEPDSRAFWQGECGGRAVTLLTRAGVIFRDNGFDLYQTGDPDFRFALLGPGQDGPIRASGRELHPAGTAEGFSRYEFGLPRRAVSMRVETLKTGKVHLTFPAGTFEELHDLWLRIRYEGDTGMAFINGRMVHDHFNNGTPWEIGLRDFLPAIGEAGVVLRIVPKPAEGGSCTQDAMGAGAVTGGDFKNLAFRSIEAEPEYRVSFTFPD